MSKPFSWREHPEVTEFVRCKFPTHSSSELSSAIYDRWQVYLSPDAIRRHYCRIREQAQRLIEPREGDVERVEEPQPAVDERFPNRRQPQTDTDVLEMYQLACQQIRIKESTFLGQTQISLNLREEHKPIAVCFWGDWQVGSQGVLMEQLLRDAETIARTDGLYVVAMGDLVQNLNQKKHPSSLHECVLPDPRDQETIALYLLRKTRKKLIGAVTGNHEENSKVASGLTLTERWCRELEVAYLWHGAKITLSLGGQEYKIGVRHKYKNESGVNTTNSQRQMHANLWPDCDVVCVGDRHFNDLQKTPRPLGDTIYLRSGSYQRTDEYGMAIGQYRGSWGLPLVVCYPDNKRVIPFYGRDFYTGLEFLEDQRRRYSSGTHCPGSP